MDWIYFLLLLGSIFIISILGIMLIKRCSAKDATVVCLNFSKDILNTFFAPAPPPKQYYPTIAGWDGTRILPQLVDAEFHSICGYFECCFCTNFVLTDDLIKYTFDIIRSPNSYDDKVLTEIIQKQAEKTVTKIMRLYDFYLSPEPLTHIELFPTKLYVAFARTADGVKVLDERKLHIQRKKAVSHRSFH